MHKHRFYGLFAFKTTSAIPSNYPPNLLIIHSLSTWPVPKRCNTFEYSKIQSFLKCMHKCRLWLCLKQVSLVLLYQPKTQSPSDSYKCSIFFQTASMQSRKKRRQIVSYIFKWPDWKQNPPFHDADFLPVPS